MPCLACDQRKQDCVYPEQQKKRGPKPRASLLNGNSPSGVTSGKSSGSTSPSDQSSPRKMESPEIGQSSVNCSPVAILAPSGEEQVVRGLQQMRMSEPKLVQGKNKRRKLSSNSEDLIPAVREMLPERSMNEEVMRLCSLLQEIIQLVQKHPHAHPFLKPVSLTDAPGYYDVIHQPMDFSTVLKKINSYQYDSLAQFYNDLNLMVENCRKFNGETNTAYLIDWAQELRQVIIEEIQKRRTSETFFLIPQPMQPFEHLDQTFRLSINHPSDSEINDLSLYEIDRCQLVYDPQIFTAPLENWSIFDCGDLLEYTLSPYSDQDLYGEEPSKIF